MRLGCGCLIGVILIVVLVGGAGWVTYQALQEPALPRITTTAADSQRAQEKIYSIVARSGPRGRPVALSEPEVNAFLDRNLVEAADVPLSELRVDLSQPERLRIAGRTTLGALLTEPPLSAVRDVVPSSWLTRTVWLQLAATPRIEKTNGRRRYLRLDVREFAVGRQRLPALPVRLMLEPGTVRLLRWPVPETIEEIRIEPGRVVVRPAS
jgi:hypothetical protein